MNARMLLSLLGLAAAGCLGPTPADELTAAGASAPIDTQVAWKVPGQACASGFVQLGVDPTSEGATPAVCVQRDFCQARPGAGDYCAATPKGVYATAAATFWSDFLVTCPAVGRIFPAALAGSAEVHLPDATAPGGQWILPMDASDVHTQRSSAGGWEPCLTNPDGWGLRDPSCDAGEGMVCGQDGDAVVDCVSTWVDDRRGVAPVQVQRVEALSRRDCASGVCEASADEGALCQEDRALAPPIETMDDEGVVTTACAPGRTPTAVRGTTLCLASSFCAVRAPGLYCDQTPFGVTDTRGWGALSEVDPVTPGALVIAGDVALQCGRDADGRATTTLFPCASATCVGNGVGFGCADDSCEAANPGIDLETLYWSADTAAIASVEGAYCSDIWADTLLDCDLVQVYDATVADYAIRLLPSSLRRCGGATPRCAHNAPGVADACVPAGAPSAG